MPLNVYGHVCLLIDDVHTLKKKWVGRRRESVSKKRSRNRDKPSHPRLKKKQTKKEKKSLLKEDVHIQCPQYKLKVSVHSHSNTKRGAPDRAPGPGPVPAAAAAAPSPSPSPASTYQKDPRSTSLVVAVPFPLLARSLADPWPMSRTDQR
ncbi:hypothetical protein FCOIX_13991 [Fusarium coicis]|nr:hypothetical protein FCOIX_13991 [Fusarium coicis]